jgi:broad specificity phosphatase PhoE
MQILVRHGLSLPNPELPTDQWPLDPAGHADITALAERLPVAAVICSDMRRAIDTARFFGPPIVDPRLREVTRPFVATLEASIREYFSGRRVEGWEPQSDVVGRYDAVLAEHGDAVYVTHGTAMALYVVSRCPGVDAYAFWNGLRNADAWVIEDDEPRRLA